MFDQLQLLYADKPDLRGQRKGYTTVSAVWATLLASAQQQAPSQQIFISDGFAFVWCATSYVAYDATFAAVITAPHDLMVTDLSTGNAVTDQPTRLANFAGLPGQPMILPYPRILPPQGGLTMTLTNKNAVAANVMVTLHGFKLYGN